MAKKRTANEAKHIDDRPPSEHGWPARWVVHRMIEGGLDDKMLGIGFLGAVCKQHTHNLRLVTTSDTDSGRLCVLGSAESQYFRS